VCESPFSYRISEAIYEELRLADMRLLRHHETFFQLSYYPSRSFGDRLDVSGRGLLPLQPGRGCPYSCTFCGGNNEAQRLINNRPKPLFQPIDGLIRTIRQAMGYGYRNFYVCFDPDPKRRYYRELFDRLRQEALDIQLIFGCWSLPDPAFLDAFQQTFPFGVFEISPETADAGLRHRAKGAISFSNEALEACVADIAARGLGCQLFFGYFLPGDHRKSVLKTRRMAHDLRGESCETFYLAFSTDPASLLQLHPEQHDTVIDVPRLRDYLEALGKMRLSSNLLAHRPSDMAPEEAEHLIRILNSDQHLYKLFPASLEFLRSQSSSREAFHRLVERVCEQLAHRTPEAVPPLQIARTVRAFSRAVEEAGELGSTVREALQSLIDYEATPYLQMERHFSGVGAHYTSTCRHVTSFPEAPEATRVSTEQAFELDVERLRTDLLAGREPVLERAPTRVRFTISSDGAYTTEIRSSA
jgi:hypothetical protein